MYIHVNNIYVKLVLYYYNVYNIYVKMFVHEYNLFLLLHRYYTYSMLHHNSEVQLHSSGYMLSHQFHHTNYKFLHLNVLY